jgi:hypothetical protein
MTISPVCLVNGSAPLPAVAVSATATVTIALANPTGVNYWSISATSTDETNTVAAINATLVVNQSAKTATFTAPAGAGSAVIFTSQVGIFGLGVDQNKAYQQSFTTTFKVNVLTGGGYPVFAANESNEQNGTFGWIADINPLLRSSATTLPTPPGTGTTVLTDISGVLSWAAPGSIAIVNITTSGSHAVAANTHYYVNLGTAGGNVTLTTAAIGAGQNFSWKLIGSTGGFSLTISPITAGSHIESSSAPGTLTTSFVANVLGQSSSFESPDGTNLYYGIP